MLGGSPIKGALLGAAGGATYGGFTGTGFMGSLLGNTAPAVLPASTAPLVNSAEEIVGPSLLRRTIEEGVMLSNTDSATEHKKENTSKNTFNSQGAGNIAAN